MKNWRSQSFEVEWKNLFDGAELTPSDTVWKNIDAKLMQGEHQVMKKKVIFYQRIAAASVGIIFLLAGYALFLNRDAMLNESQPLTNTSSNQETHKNSEALNAHKKPEVDGTQQSVAHSRLTGSEEAKPGINGKASIAVDSIENKTNSFPMFQTGLLSVRESNRKAESFFWNSKPVATLTLVNTEKLPSTVKPNDYSIAYRLADARPAVIVPVKSDFVKENKWASVGFSGGKFAPGASGREIAQIDNRNSSASFANLNSSQPNIKSDKVKVGTSMAFVVSAGKRIFKKWVLQGGVSYLNQTSTSESSVLNVAPANVIYDSKVSNSFSPQTTSSVTYSTESNINSNFQFISVPILAGYMVVDKKFGVQINGGFSPDFFIKNSVYDQTTKVETINSGGGVNDTFKSVSVAGVGGIEVSYGFSKHYRLSLVPGVRYSLTPVYNSVSLASARPFVASVGMRFRYIFNN